MLFTNFGVKVVIKFEFQLTLANLCLNSKNSIVFILGRAPERDPAMRFLSFALWLLFTISSEKHSPTIALH